MERMYSNVMCNLFKTPKIANQSIEFDFVVASKNVNYFIFAHKNVPANMLH